MTAQPPQLTRRDHAIVGGLVLALAVVAVAIAAPALSTQPAADPSGSPASSPVAAASPVSASPRLLREGVVGTARLVNPLLAASRADETVAALVFSGLVRLGEGQTLRPDLASEWTTADEGRVWTFTLRDDARWHDGEPVTARDVAFTVGLLRDPAWTGPGAASWRDVTATAVDERTVRFELETPIGGFLQAATQRILPAHLLQGVPIDRLANDPFNRAPVGSGPFRLTSLDERRAVLVPAEREAAPAPAAPSASTTPTPSLATDGAAPAGIEVRFFADTAALAAAYAAGELDVAAGLPAQEATDLAAEPDSRLLRYPTSTLTAVLFNLRPARPEFRDPRVRIALLRGIDRPGVVEAAWEGQAAVADAPIPQVSWAFDPVVTAQLGYDRTGATRALADAGWTPADGKWTAPGGSEPFAFDLLSPDVATNQSSFLAAATIAGHWQRMGLTVTHRPLPPADLVARLRAGDFAAAVVDINVGLDPDLYPLLGSTQVTSQGLNLAAVADPDLDKLLVAARAPGTLEARRTAYRALQVRLAERQYLLPIAFRDELAVVRETVVGPSIRQVASPGDRFWDVLSWRLADGR